MSPNASPVSANGAEDEKGDTEPPLRATHNQPPSEVLRSEESYMDELKSFWRRFISWFGSGLPADVLEDPTFPGRNLNYERFSDYLQGYPRFAAWQASDPNFAIGKNYADLRVRIRLHMQHRVEKLKAQLQDLDRRQHGEDPYLLTSIEEDIKEENGERDKLMKELGEALKEHDELELREKEFCSLPRPKERNYRSLINYLYNKRDVCEEEEKYFLYPEQMVSLANGTDNSWLDSKVEEVLDRLPNSDKIFTREHLRRTSPHDDTHYYSKERVEILSKTITVIIAATTLAIPIALLNGLGKKQTAHLGLALTFVIVFPALLATCTRLRQQEIFAVSAAYCAVLVVFLGNMQFNQATCTCPPTASPAPTLSSPRW